MTTVRFAARPSDGTPVRVEGTAADVIVYPQKLDPASLNLQTKGGTPEDADIVYGAADGDIVLDTSAHRIWVRSGGTWKYIALT